jgi:hypothetical protein
MMFSSYCSHNSRAPNVDSKFTMINKQLGTFSELCNQSVCLSASLSVTILGAVH